MGNKFPALNRSFAKVGRGVLRYGQNVDISGVEFIALLKNKLDSDLPNTINFIRISLSSMKKSYLKYVYNIISDEINDSPSDFIFLQWYLIILDIIECKLYRPIKPKNKRKPPKNLCHISFSNKGVELLNLPRILHDPSLADSLPNASFNFEVPTVVYTLCDPIGSKIFNFNQFVNEVDINGFLQDVTSLLCSCSDSPFTDPHHKHVVTGDLRIIKHSKLRKLFAKGPKYREPSYINWDDVKNCVVSGVRSCVEEWCENNSVQPIILHDWLNAVLKLVDDKIDFLKSTTISHRVNPLLKKVDVQIALKELQNKYVICPIDKATGNIALICKRFYALVLSKELGLTNTNGVNVDNTYEINNSNPLEVVDQHFADMNSKFNINCSDENKCLPKMYWLPKMHKTPSKARFIVAAPICSMKLLSKAVTDAFDVSTNR